MSEQLSIPEAGNITIREAGPVHGLTFRVHGVPAPQGSKKAFVVKGRPVIVDDSKRTKPWRESVKFAALEERRLPGRPNHATFEGPVSVWIVFLLPRPKVHYGTGRNAGVVKESAPARPVVKPDLDKLCRSTFDALKEAGVYKDDQQVVDVVATKTYADGSEGPGALITVARVQS